jgi:SGNH domain-containing protein
VLAACFAFGWFFLPPDEYANLGKHIVGTASYLENFVLWREAGYFDASSYLKPLMHLWSLAGSGELQPTGLFSSPQRLCRVPRVQVDARNRAYREVALELQKEFTGLKVFDPLPYLCDSSACYAMSAGHLLYSDDNHLSKAGAVYVSGKFLEERSSKE